LLLKKNTKKQEQETDCKRNHPRTSTLLNQANGKQQAKNNRFITTFKFAKWKVGKTDYFSFKWLRKQQRT